MGGERKKLREGAGLGRELELVAGSLAEGAEGPQSARLSERGRS